MQTKNKKLKRLAECLLVFISVGTLYFIIECIYKQRMSHWSMFILAGIVGLIAMLLNDFFTYEMDYLLQISICTFVCTLLEYLVGITLNATYEIWDYRNVPLNLNGHICVPFSIVWAILFAILIPILDYVEWKEFQYKPNTPPYYKIFNKTIFKIIEMSKTH